MKKLILLLLLSSKVFASSYYFSQLGDDKNSGLTTALPKRSLNTANGLPLSGGDSVLFKCGDSFYGTLSPKVSGIYYGSYSSGSKPVITGFTTISSWTNLGGNIWVATVPNGLRTLNMVVIDGQIAPMGRYPNAGTTNSGYLTYESFSANTSITDSQLPNEPNWTGAEVVIRLFNWATARSPITVHTGSTINYKCSADIGASKGYGYFIQNSERTLDTKNEWYYYDENGIKKIKLYATSNPGQIQVATLGNLVEMNYATANLARSNISFDGLQFTGSEGSLINIQLAHNVTLRNCDFFFAGINAIDYKFSTYLTIQNSIIKDINNTGIHEFSSNLTNHITIQNNIIKKVGLHEGLLNNLFSFGDEGSAILANSGDLTIKENIIDSIGYNGIALRQNNNNTLLRKNTVSNFCMIKSDGGGIYNGGQRGQNAANNIIIDSNIVFNSVGETGGTTAPYDKHVKGIYLDATSQAVSVFHNTIYNCFIGLSISEAQNNILRNNTIFNTGVWNPWLNYYSSQMNVDDGLAAFKHCSGNIITNNIFFAKQPNQLIFLHNDNFQRVDSIGIIDSNYYAMPFGDFPAVTTNTNSIITNYSMLAWKAKWPIYNIHSSILNYNYSISKIITTGTNKVSNDLFSNNMAGWSSSSTPTAHTLSWDNTNAIMAGGAAKLTSSAVSGNFTKIYITSLPDIESSKKYVVRFKTRASAFGSYKTYLQQWIAPYKELSDVQYGSIDTAVQQHENIITWNNATTSNGALFLLFSQNKSTIYIDDVQVFEIASISENNSDNNFIFRVNTTNKPIIYNFSGYKKNSIDGTVYKDMYTIPPYSSIILFNNQILTGNTTDKNSGGIH